MKRTKKLLSFFLAIMMVITTIPAFTLTASAGNWSGYLTTTDSAGYRYYAGHDVFYRDSNRINSSGVSGAVTPTINVCNDGERGNFCAGLWVFDMNSNIPTSIKSLTATLTIKVINANGDSRGVNFYITGDTPSNVNNSSSLNGNADSVKAVKGYFNSTGLTLVRSVAQSEVNQTKTYTIDVSELVKNARLNGWNRFNVLAIQETAGDKNSNNTRWSDLHIEKPKIYVNAVEKALSTTVTAEDNANSSTGRVILDDAIYTYESESAYYNYGTNISTLDPWDTQVVCKSGSPSDITSIICLDSGAKLSLNGTNKLQGNLLANKFKVSGNTGVNATLLFTFKDGTQEYHRVAVKSYPVENHIACEAVQIGSWGSRTESGYTMFMRGSTGAGGADGVWKFQKSYATSGTSTHAIDGTNGIITSDKKAYAHGYSEGGDAVPNVISKATYYIDKSCRTYPTWLGLGNSELWNGSQYSIPIEVIRTRFFHNGGGGWNFDKNNMPVQNKLDRTTNASLGYKDDNGTTYGLAFTHNASVNESNRYSSCNDTTCNIRIGVRTTGAGYALLKTNLIVKLFDKSTARKKYDDLIKLNLKENDYTASSFAKYQNALMDMEAYLSNYEDTDTSKMTSLVNSLNTAKDSLVERGDTQTVLNKLAAFQAVANEQKNYNKYTTTSYNNFINEQMTNKDENLTAALNLKTDTLAQRELTVALENTYINTIQHYLDFLDERADFTALDQTITNANNIISNNSSLYTKSSIATLRDYINNADNLPYANRTTAERNNTAKDDYQSNIDSEKANVEAEIAKLQLRANMSAYNNALYTAVYTDGYLNSYTSSSVDVLPTYDAILPYDSIPYFSSDDTPDTKQTEVNTATSNLGNANSNIYDSSNQIYQVDLKAFIKQNFDLDVVDNSNIKTQKDSAKGLYKTVEFNGTTYHALDVTSQSDLDAKLRGYINSINSTLGEYDIKVPAGVTVAVANNTQTPTSTTDGISTYRLTYGVPVTFTSSNADTAWYMSYVSNVAKRGMQYQCSGKTYATKVMGNMTITPKARVNDTTPNKVTVVRQYSDGSSSAMLIDYVNGSYVLPTAQTYPNYTFTGYEVNGTAYNAGATVAITGDTVIYAKYTAAGGDHQIIITDTTGTRTDKTYKYNSAVKLDDPNAYAWIEKPIGSDTWRPSYIGTGCSYKVTEPMELKAVATVDEMKQLCGTKEAYAPNLRFNGPLVADGKGVVFHGQFINYVPAGAQIVEYGVAVNTNNANSFDLINTNGKVIRCKSTNPMKSNQFSVGARYNGNTFTSSTAISYRSYMIYQITVNNQLETRYAYSDVRTFNPNA